MRSGLIWGFLPFLVVSAASAAPPDHTLSITFDYDFRPINSCKIKASKPCVTQFLLYDITGPKPVLLFTMNAPKGEKKARTGLTGSGSVPLTDGLHTFALTAQLVTGEESDPTKCTATATVGKNTKVSLNFSRSQPKRND